MYRRHMNALGSATPAERGRRPPNARGSVGSRKGELYGLQQRPKMEVAGLPGKREAMEAQRLLEVAPFGPETVKVLKRALEEAWASISPTIPPDRVDDTRLSLAHAIVAHAGSGESDYETLKAAALEAVQKHPPQSPA
jgi:hypothetical protein